MEKTFRKTRIAPTPSGYLHMGNVLSFVVTAALAQKTGARILLRIDDMDRERTNKEFVQDIFDTLNFLDIPWHEGPKNLHEYETEYSQVHRVGLYSKALDQLVESGNVFACACTRAQMLKVNAERIYPNTCNDKGFDLNTKDACWRLDTRNAGALGVNTLDGVIAAPFPTGMSSFVVKKKDGYPAYQLTSIIDDEFYGIDLVVRGEDLWHSTLAQLYLAKVMGKDAFADTTFYHHALVMESPGEKLSKSAGATSIQYLRKQGKKPSDIFTAIALSLGIPAPAKDWQELASHMKLL
jgi:glutamyl/glutaminyl-tRNA synthetase